MNDHRETPMLSRVADNLYWMSRYLERAEHTARLIDVDLQLRLDQSPTAGSACSRRYRFQLRTMSHWMRKSSLTCSLSIAPIRLQLSRVSPPPAKIFARSASSAARKCGSN